MTYRVYGRINNIAEFSQDFDRWDEAIKAISMIQSVLKQIITNPVMIFLQVYSAEKGSWVDWVDEFGCHWQEHLLLEDALKNAKTLNEKRFVSAAFCLVNSMKKNGQGKEYIKKRIQCLCDLDNMVKESE